MQDFFLFFKKKIEVGCRLNAVIEIKIYNPEPNFLPDIVLRSKCNNYLTTLNC